MERKIGEIFTIDNITLKVVEKDDCEGCYFYNKGESYPMSCPAPLDCGGCVEVFRENAKSMISVIFKKVD